MPSLCRLFSCVSRCVAAGEPVLLVGDTGAGKTTVCQLLAVLRAQPLRILNCHAHTETADFIGGYRPTRTAARAAGAPPFAWVDGPLLTTMRDGSVLLLDELSLAQDGVLERLNSVLESGHSITLAERAGEAPGSCGVEVIVAAPTWRLLATMNPGGDFGKRELSPALRNRFTELWVPALSERDELRQLVAPRLGSDPLVAPIADAIADFWCVPDAASVRTRAAARPSGISHCRAGGEVADDYSTGVSQHSQSQTSELSLPHAWGRQLESCCESHFFGCLKRFHHLGRLHSAARALGGRGAAHEDANSFLVQHTLASDDTTYSLQSFLMRQH